MYPVSEAFLQAVQENTRRYYWTGRITTTKGASYEFGADDIVKGSGYISSQCCGSTEIELGTVYATEMGITLLSDIDRYTLEDALVELFVISKKVSSIVVGGFISISFISQNNTSCRDRFESCFLFCFRVPFIVSIIKALNCSLIASLKKDDFIFSSFPQKKKSSYKKCLHEPWKYVM